MLMRLSFYIAAQEALKAIALEQPGAAVRVFDYYGRAFAMYVFF